MNVDVLKDVVWADRNPAKPHFNLKKGAQDLPDWLGKRMIETKFAKPVKDGSPEKAEEPEKDEEPVKTEGKDEDKPKV